MEVQPHVLRSRHAVCTFLQRNQTKPCTSSCVKYRRKSHGVSRAGSHADSESSRPLDSGRTVERNEATQRIQSNSLQPQQHLNSGDGRQRLAKKQATTNRATSPGVQTTRGGAKRLPRPINRIFTHDPPVLTLQQRKPAYRVCVAEKRPVLRCLGRMAKIELRVPAKPMSRRVSASSSTSASSSGVSRRHTCARVKRWGEGRVRLSEGVRVRVRVGGGGWGGAVQHDI